MDAHSIWRALLRCVLSGARSAGASRTKPLVRLVVEDHHAGTREMQLLDGAQAHRVQAADDHVADPLAAELRM